MNKVYKMSRSCIMLCAAAVFCGCGSSGTADAKQTTAAQISETGTAQTVDSASAAVVEETTSAAESVPEEETSLTAAEVFDTLRKSGLCDELDAVETLGGETFDGVCEKLYGIAPSELSEGGVMFVSSGTLADEVSVLGGKEGLADLLKERGASRAKEFEGYAPEEHTKAEKAIVFEHKGLSVLVISDNADKIKKSILAM